MRARIVVGVVVAVLGAACSRGGSEGGELRVVPLDGEVFFLSGEEREPIDGPQSLRPGDTVATGPDGRVRLVLAEGRVLELAPGSTVRVGSPGAVELVAGRALVAAPPGIGIRSGEARIQGIGDFRLDRYVGALRLGVYTGSATVEGWDGEVGSLQQVGVAAGIVPRAPQPLEVDPSDVWDSRKLGDAINLGLELDDLQRGLRPQLDGDASPALLGQVLPEDFPVRASQGRLRGVDPDEALVAAMVALQAAREDGITPLRALGLVMGLRELGASWIVVVARWELYSQAILRALAKVTGLVASILVPVVATGGTDADVGGAPTSTGGGSSGGGSGGAPSSGGGGSGGGTPPPPSGGSPGGGGTPGGGGGSGGGGSTCGNEVECAVEDVIGDAGGGLGDGLGIGP